MLKYLIFLAIISCFHFFFASFKNDNAYKKLALLYSGIIFLFSLILWIFINNTEINLNYYFSISWIPFYNYIIGFGVDSLSLFFIILSTLLVFLCILGSWNSIKNKVKEYYFNFLILNLLLILVFSVRDIFLFYIFFESVLIPMFLIIGIWGSRERKIRAVYLFFFYTLVGSLLMLLAIIYIYEKFGTSNYDIILTLPLTISEQSWLWIAFFFSLATKMPLFPFHIWLPEAHVEAPTSGSVLLAGILLKLGSYGFLRFSLQMFPDASVYFVPLIYTFSILGIIYTSLTAIRQTDFKRIIAYSSVAHMNLVMLGIFSFNFQGISGGFMQSISHGFVASSLFFLIGVIYERYHSRLVTYYSGLTHVMPIYIFIFLFFTMANIAMPGTSSFIGEFLILAGLFHSNVIGAVFASTGIILSGAYALWLFNRIAYGNLKSEYIQMYTDLTLREFLIFLPLFLGTLLFGVFPDVLLSAINVWCYNSTSTYLF